MADRPFGGFGTGGGGIARVRELPEARPSRVVYVKETYVDDSGRTIHEDFWYVHPHTREWVRSFGIPHVLELPPAEPGLIVFLEETYHLPGPWLDADFNLTITPASVVAGGHPALGYSSAAQVVAGNNYIEAGSVAPLPEGLEALLIQGNAAAGSGVGGTLFIKLSGDLLAQAAGRDLTVTFDGNSYPLHPFEGIADAWVSTSNANLVPEADWWTDGAATTVRVFVTGTQIGLNSQGFAAIGEMSKPPFGPYRAEDFDVTVTPAGLPAGGVVTQRTGYAARELQSTNAAFGVTGAGGAISPAGSPFLGIFVGFNARGPLTVLPTEEAGDAFRALNEGAGDKILATIGAKSYTLAPALTGGSPSFFWNSENAGTDQILGVDAWAAGTPVTLRITSEDGQVGFTPEGVRTIGQGLSPRNIVGGTPVEQGFWHVNPETGEWVEGLGGGIGGGGIPAGALFEDGLSAADIANHKWKGVLVGLAREDSGPEWRIRTRAGQEAIDARQATYTVTSGGTSLTVTMAEAEAPGVAGNDWSIDFRADSTGTSAGRQGGTTVIVVFIGAGATFANIASVINQRAALDGNRYSAVVTGTGSDAFPAAPRGVVSFAGGLDAVPAAELGVEMEVATKIIELEHLTGHTQAEIVEFLNEYEIDTETTLYATLYGGSDGTANLAAAPQERPFGQTYSTGSLPRPTEDEIQTLRDRLDGLTFADIAGEAADSQIPALIARDSEVATAVANLRNGVKAAYDTLKELADKVVTGVAVRNGRIVLTHDDGTETTADASSLTRTDAQINALIQAGLQAAVSGNTESGIVVTYNNDGTLDFTVTATGGGGGASVAQTLAAILAGTGISIDRSQTGQITISATGAGPVQAADHFRFGLSADTVPTEAEATIQANNGVGDLPVFTNMHVLIYRLATEPDITSVLFSDDPTMDNEVLAFTKYAVGNVDVGGSVYKVWYSNQALTHDAVVTMTVR